MASLGLDELNDKGIEDICQSIEEFRGKFGDPAETLSENRDAANA